MAITTTQIKELLIKTFDLSQTVDEITDDTAIVGAGLELDSVDILEILSQVDKQFKIKIRNQDVKKEVFSSVGKLTAFLNNYKG